MGKALSGLFLVGLLLLLLLSPESPAFDRSIALGNIFLTMIHLALWDARNARFRLPHRVPSAMILILPGGLALFTCAKTEWGNWLQIVIGFSPFVVYSISLAEEWIRTRRQ